MQLKVMVIGPFLSAVSLSTVVTVNSAIFVFVEYFNIFIAIDQALTERYSHFTPRSTATECSIMFGVGFLGSDTLVQRKHKFNSFTESYRVTPIDPPFQLRITRTFGTMELQILQSVDGKRE